MVFVIGVIEIVIVIITLILHFLILTGFGFYEFFFSVRVWFFLSLNFHVVVRTRFTVGWSDSR